jgi:speckle-type POZ protein
MTEPLFMAADKYQVEGLKEACANILIRKLTLKNVVHFLIVGHLYSAPKLKEAALRCLKTHRGEVWFRP